MKKKILIVLFAICAFCLTACGNKDLKLNDYLIEERQNLFIAQDEVYTVSLSSGMREENYNFDGVKNNMTEFGIVTIARLDSAPMGNFDYNYTIKVDDQTFTGKLEKSEVENSYIADIEKRVNDSSSVSVQIVFGSTSFNKEMTNISSKFEVNSNKAIEIANQTLKKDIKQLTSDKNNKIEAVMKIVKDSSSADPCNYYWYVGVVSTNGEILGVLVDSSNGQIIAKKV